MNVSRFQSADFEVLAVPMWTDNFNYLVCRDGKAVLIDASEARPIFQLLETEKLQLLSLLITHADSDHVAGCRAIQDRLGVQSRSAGVEAATFSVLGTPCRSIASPGHVAVHKMYHFPDLGILFSGDVLINGGCGRIKEGTAEQLFSSLQKICALPDETRVFGGHDYLVQNMEFALSVEPENADMQARLDLYRTDPASALFTTVAEEKKTNPFLRVETAEAFAELRHRKDLF